MKGLDPGRVLRAAEALAEERVRILPDHDSGAYDVSSFTGEETYHVRLTPERSCDCPDARFRGVTTCKHVAVILLAGAGTGRNGTRWREAARRR